jgi:hypothetical protein
MDNYPDKIFVKNNLTTMEKLLFAEKHIEALKQELSELKQEIGVLTSENQEYKYSDAEERRVIKTDAKVKFVLSERLVLEKEVRKLRVENNNLLTENLQLKNLQHGQK